MGRRDDGELNLSDAEVAAAEEYTRRILARWGEPAPAPPPPALSARVTAALEGRPVRKKRRYIGLGISAFVALALFFILGTWGVFGSSLGLATFFGGPESVLGSFLLTAALIAKPLVNLTLAVVAYAFPAVILLLGVAWLWWRLLRSSLRPEVL